MAISAAARPGFTGSFASWSKRVRARLWVRRTLTGTTLGACAAAVCAGALWWFGHADLRLVALTLVGAGAVAGAVSGFRRRLSDADLALYLDAKLGSGELISTALELCRTAARDAAAEAVISRATLKLRESAPDRARPRVLLRAHTLAVIGAAALVWLQLLPARADAAGASRTPGARRIQADVADLERIEELERLQGRDPEQSKRLRELAERARKLREELRRGIEQREALSEIARLRDDVARERLRFGDADNRAGLDAAVRQLQAREQLGKAAEALGNGDLVEFDEQMQSLANRVEKADRDEAKQALDDAAKRAKERGAKALAEYLERQRGLFDEREADATALRELADALRDQLSEDALRDLEEFGESGSPEARRRLAEAMERALKELDAEQRKRLAEQLGKRAGNGDVEPLTKEQLEDLARRLATPEGQEELRKQLQRMAEAERDPEADRDRALEDAERGGAAAQRGLGGAIPVPGQGRPGTPPQAGKPGQPGGTPGGGGPSPGGERGNHAGSTPPVPGAKPLVAKAQGALNPGIPMHGASLGRAPARPGETANQQGVGAVGSVGPAEVGAVERSEVPEEYREQVGRYFQP
jgi:hypothetical protein